MLHSCVFYLTLFINESTKNEQGGRWDEFSVLSVKKTKTLKSGKNWAAETICKTWSPDWYEGSKDFPQKKKLVSVALVRSRQCLFTKHKTKKKQQKMFPSSPLPWPPAVSATPRLNSWQLTRGSPLALRARARRFALYIRIRKVPGVTDGGGGARSWIDLPLAVKILAVLPEIE